MIDLLGLGALALVAAEWLALGWLSGVRFPQPGGTPANWALRLLVGSCLVAFAGLLLSLVGVGFATIPLTLVVAAVAAGSLRLLHGRVGDYEVKERVPPGVDSPLTRGWLSKGHTRVGFSASLMPVVRERVGWLVLGAVLLAATVRSLLVPEAGWDAFSHWGLRAQAFAVAGTMVDAHSEHEYYPPLVPLLEAWLYLHRGLVSIDLGKTVWALIGGAFAVCLGWQLRLVLGVRWTWLAAYLAAGIVLASTGLLEGFWTGQADLPLTAFLTLATLAAWQWHITRDRLWLLEAGVFAAAAGLTKFEGLPRVAIVVLAVLIEGVLARDMRMWLPAVVVGLSAAAASLAWTVFELAHGIAPNGEHIGAFQPLAVGSVLIALVAVFRGFRTGGGLLVAALAWLISFDELVRPPLRLLVLVVVCQALATLMAFLLSSTSPALQVTTSATRLVEQFLPLALFVGAVGMSRIVHL